MNTIELTALDTVFFKDGKPFSMGEESSAQGVFPPYPSVMRGMLRSIWFADGHMADFPKAAQADDPTRAIQVTGYLPGLNGAAAFPIPLDLYQLKGADDAQALRFQAEKLPEGIVCDYAHKLLLQPQGDEKIAKLGGIGLLKAAEFARYLAGDPGPFDFHKMDQFTTEEPKVGIGRDPKTRTASEGQLYRLAMRRLQGPEGEFSIFLKSEGLDLPKSGITRIGAEARAAQYRAKAFPEIACPFKASDQAQEFRLYLATPAIFREGAVPKKMLAAHGIEVLGCTNGRTAHIGGFDMVNKRPKCMFKAVPAGTIYYLRAKNGLTKELIAALHEGSIYNLAGESDWIRNEYAPQGFGLSYLGHFSSPLNH